MDNNSCSVTECPKPVFCRGWCAGHYGRWRKHGTPLHGGELKPRRAANPICIVADCDRPHQGHGYCGTHLYRVRKYGTPQPIGRSAARTPADVFKLVMPEEPPPAGVVWPWRGPVNVAGYGMVHLRGQQIGAHRVSYELFIGPIPAGYVIRHKNDMPIDVNPHNLEPGTNADNIADRQLRSRQARGTDFGRSKLTDEAVYESRLLYATGGYSMRALAARFGISKHSMSQVLRGKTWKHVPMPPV